MKYCPECGTQLEKNNKQNKERACKKKSKLPNAAGNLALFATVFCFFIGINGIMSCWSYESDWSGYANYTYLPQNLIVGVIAISAFLLGIISAILIFKRILFSLTIVGFALIMITAGLTAGLNFVSFILAGIPMLVMAIIGTVFVCVCKKEFTS